MSNQYPRLSAVALVTATVAFVLFAAGSVAAWRLFPYPAGADDLQRQMIWMWHTAGEKLGQCVLVAVLAFVAARLHRPSWKIGIVTGVLAVVIFQFISIGVYVGRFGLEAYQTYNTFWGTLQFNVPVALLFGFFAVWGQYRRERQGPTIRSSELPPADAAGSRSP